MANHTDEDTVARAADLRDAAINASAAAWRVTGVDAGALIRSGEDYGRPLSDEEMACSSPDCLGWATMADTARRIADAWTRAAEAWQAADAHVQSARAVAIAELKRQRAANDERPSAPTEVEQMPWRRRPEPFRITTRPSYRSARRTTVQPGDSPAD
jgi:hypothetical protein